MSLLLLFITYDPPIKNMTNTIQPCMLTIFAFGSQYCQQTYAVNDVIQVSSSEQH